MNKKDIVDLYNILMSFNGSYTAKFSYFISKNKSLINPEINVLKEIEKPSKEFLKYEKEKLNTIIKYAVKKEDGNPLIINNQYKIDNVKGFELEHDKLKEKYKDCIKEKETKDKEIEEILNEEIEIELYKIKIDLIPDIEVDKMDVLIKLDLIE